MVLRDDPKGSLQKKPAVVLGTPGGDWPESWIQPRAEALRNRIRSQSRAVADHIAADPEAQAFLDDWATPEPLSP